ncbi:cobalamin B12-binding domain-containing protein [Streptomyces albidoflavus]
MLTTTPSDSHSWNLVFLGLLLTELGCRVVNVGPCPPGRLVVDFCVREAPDLIVVSSVNGHGAEDGVPLAHQLRAVPQLRTTPMVIGGKLGIEGRDAEAGRLEEAGFTRVLGEDVESLSRLVAAVKAGTAP